eukprot:CAMPEP_0115008200 /NCGR_PEP_ID=MMETSP0216-20121206/21743_1 /TAXON_ID=223996 /ORGANISM="Protocruzia adherens, Strain Boccale" /LENGTH=463 /DNA_ID=CAMNT_0002375507 /DNA_START=40 /DNA_END=1431 /DNA_ORIENTATION=+
MSRLYVTFVATGKKIAIKAVEDEEINVFIKKCLDKFGQGVADPSTFELILEKEDALVDDLSLLDKDDHLLLRIQGSDTAMQIDSSKPTGSSLSEPKDATAVMLAPQTEVKPQTPSQKYAALLKQFSSTVDEGALLASIKTLQLVIFNLAQNPYIDKVRRLKTDGQSYRNKLGPHASIRDILKELKYKPVANEEAIFVDIKDVDMNEIRAALFEVNEIATSIGLPRRETGSAIEGDSKEEEKKSSFNPYQAGYTSLDPGARRADNNRRSEYERVNDNLKELKTNLETTGIARVTERKPRVFMIPEGANMNAVLKEIHFDSVAGEQTDAQRAASEYQKIIKLNEKRQNFHSRSKDELATLQGTKVYYTTRLRVKFPNRTFVEGEFARKEKISDLHQFIKDFLVAPDKPFYLYVTPPVKKLTKLSDTFEQHELVPNGTILFSWTDENRDGPFLSEEVESNMEILTN